MNVKEFFRKAQFFLMLTLGTYPACACIVAFIAPELLPYMWLPCGLFCLLGWISLLVPSKLRLAVGILGCALFLVPPYLLLQENARVIEVLFGIGYSALLLWSLRIGGWEQNQELPAGWLAVCITFLMIGCGLSYYDPMLKSAALGIRISMFVFVFLALRSLNRSSLSLAAGGKGGITSGMRRKNWLLILGMFALAILVALIPSGIRLLESLFRWLLTLFSQPAVQQLPTETVVETTAPLTTEVAVGGGGGGGTVGGIEGYIAPVYTSESTYKAMAIVALCAIIPFTIFVLWRLSKFLWKLSQKYMEKIAGNATNMPEDFVDEITDIRDEAGYRKSAPEKKKSQPVFVRFTPTEKIRNRYKRLLEKHPQWQGSSTARENLKEDAAAIYEKARYSSHTVTEQDAENFKNKTK